MNGLARSWESSVTAFTALPLSDPLAQEDQIERGAFSEWTADALPEFVEMERCLLLRIRIPRIPPVRCEVVPEIGMKLVRSRLRENVDAAVPEPVVFGRERILIDSDLTDRVLGRELSATESIDVKAPAVRSGGRTGEGLEIGSQIVGVIGERVKIGAAQDYGARVRRGFGADAGSAAILHRHFLFSAVTWSNRFKL